MKNINKILVVALTSGALISCAPGPITLGSKPKEVVDNQGTVHYVNYKVDKKRMVTVPAGLKGSDLITAKIQASFAQDPILNPYNIGVETHRGVVKLSGKVPNNDVKKYAIKVARYTKGVLAVEPKNLVVGG